MRINYAHGSKEAFNKARQADAKKRRSCLQRLGRRKARGFYLFPVIADCPLITAADSPCARQQQAYHKLAAVEFYHKMAMRPGYG